MWLGGFKKRMGVTLFDSPSNPETLGFCDLLFWSSPTSPAGQEVSSAEGPAGRLFPDLGLGGDRWAQVYNLPLIVTPAPSCPSREGLGRVMGLGNYLMRPQLLLSISQPGHCLTGMQRWHSEVSPAVCEVRGLVLYWRHQCTWG